MNRSQKHDKLLVFDLELTCWENHYTDENGDQKIDKNPPEGMFNEIIQFGYALVDMKTRKIIEKGSWLIKPTKSEISEFCTKLTGISQKMIDEDGISFEKFRKIISKKGWKYIPSTSWGYGDIIQFREHCEVRNLESPLSKSHFCCKTLFGTWTGRTKGFGVKNSLKRLNLEFEGEQHDAMWDAVNTAKVLLNSIYSTKG